MDLKQLKYFLAVAQELNISRAAKVIHISQPPLTRQIANLEQEVGVKLFERSRSGVKLTQAGELLLKDARQIFALVENAKEKSKNAGLGRIGHINAAVFGSAMFDAVPQLLANFQATHPGVEIVLHVMNKDVQIQALLENKINMGFNRLPTFHQDIKCQKIKSEKLILAIHKKNPLANSKQIEISDLKNIPLILIASGPRPNYIDEVLEIYKSAKLRPTISQTAEDPITGVCMVAAGFGICLVPESVSYVNLPGIAYLPVKGIGLGTADLFCIHRRNDDEPVMVEFISEIKKFKATKGNIG